MKKRIMSLLLAVGMMINMLPLNVFATTFGGAERVTGEIHEEVAQEQIEMYAEREVDLSGKVISILGDSISTFAGYIPTEEEFTYEIFEQTDH